MHTPSRFRGMRALLLIGLTLQVGAAIRAEPATEPAAPTPPAVAAAPDAPAAPAAPAAAPTTAAPTTAEPLGAEPAPAATAEAAAGAGPLRLLILPVDFRAQQKSAGGVVEPVPSWTETSRQNIAKVVEDLLGHDARFQRVALPELDAEEQRLLREHIELFKVIAVDVNRVLSYGGKAWADKRSDFDYTVGDGLAFLRARSGADAALIVAGGQTTQSGGSVFMQFVVAGLTGVALPGGGSFLVTGIVRLEDGRIQWFNSLLGAEILGIKAFDMRNGESAQKTLTGLFAPYPSSPLVGRKIF